jgi:hypothetical protein
MIVFGVYSAAGSLVGCGMHAAQAWQSAGVYSLADRAARESAGWRLVTGEFVANDPPHVAAYERGLLTKGV